jgi:4-amino-4-deoxy-L-arabinose transferase-like glycosyltransferase
VQRAVGACREAPSIRLEGQPFPTKVKNPSTMSASNADSSSAQTSHAQPPTSHNGLESPAASDAEAASPDREAETRASGAPFAEPAWARQTVLIVLAVAALFFVAPIAQSGLWDPFEFNVAELSRRIAVNAYGAHGLSLDGADNSMPRLGDLGRGELAFDSIAIGFRVFGLHEWAGRLPLSLWGVAGVLALYWLLARLVDRRAGLYGAVVLSTMPLYFMQARTMLGEVVPMAAISMALAGLGVAVFDGPGVPLPRKLAVALGALGLLFGFMSRGALIGVAIPALGVGLSWAAMWASSQRKPERFGDVAGAACLAVGLAAAWGGTSALFRTNAGEYSMLLGAAIAVQAKFPTFDLVIHYLGHSLVPWSAFIPFAVGRIFRSPPVMEGGESSEARATAARLLMLVGAAVAFGVYSMMAPRVGYLAFGAPSLLAAMAAVSIRDFERGAPASRALGIGVAVLTALFLRDYVMFPEKGLSAFAVTNPTFPDSFKDRAGALIFGCSALFVLVVFFAWLEERNRPWFRRDDYLAWPRALASAWGGNLLLGLVVLEAILIVLAINVYVAMHVLHAKWIAPVGLQIRVVLLNAFWVVPMLVFVVVWVVMLLRDAFRWFFDKTGVSRGMATAGAGLLAGGLLSFAYYPALASQLSPKEVFNSYERLHGKGEPLALLGIGGKSAAYYKSGDAQALGDVNSAFAWLTSSADRRWLAVRNEDLAKLNSLFRGRPGVKQNLPVLDARSSQNMLVSNMLRPGERNASPFQAFVLDAEPTIGHRVEANLQDQLLSLGWDVTDGAGNPVDYVVPGRKYHFRLYYKVLAPISGEWETFIHIDGFHRRFNGDHKTLKGKYSFSLWQPGDFIVDDDEISLEPNFSAGHYNVYYGLFTGDTRLKVKTGRHDDHRIEGGQIRVQ